MKKIWLLLPVDEKRGPWYDVHDRCFGFVIRAERESDARHLAAINSDNEGDAVWYDCRLTSCKVIGSNARGITVVLLKDVHTS